MSLTGYAKIAIKGIFHKLPRRGLIDSGTGRSNNQKKVKNAEYLQLLGISLSRDKQIPRQNSGGAIIALVISFNPEL